MRTHNIHFQDKMIDLKLFKLYYNIYSCGKKFKGLENVNEFKIAVVNETLVVEPLKFSIVRKLIE